MFDQSASRELHKTISLSVQNQMPLFTCTSIDSIESVEMNENRERTLSIQLSLIDPQPHILRLTSSAQRMCNCFRSKTRAIALFILFGAVLISAATAIALSIGLSRNRTVSQATTGQFALQPIRRGLRHVHLLSFPISFQNRS